MRSIKISILCLRLRCLTKKLAMHLFFRVCLIQKGEAGLRRLGRARALMRRAANHLNSDPSPASVERVGNYKKHGLARYEANDRLAQSHTIDVLGYSIDDTRFEDNSPELV